MRDPPVLLTERLTLRAHRLADFDDCAAMWADPVVTRYIGGRPFSEEEVWTKLLRYAGHWSVLGFGYWVAHEKGSERFVGEVGLADFKRDIQPSLGGIPEIGWALSPWAYGRGLATESVRAVVAWWDAEFRAARTACLIAPDNTASIRVAEKCGYRELHHTTYRGLPTLIFGRG